MPCMLVYCILFKIYCL